MADLTPELDIFAQQTGASYGVSLEELAVRELIDEIREKGEMTRAKQVLCVTALALAQNIARGNTKGRAVANEAAQLAAIVEQLTEEATADEGDLPPELRELLEAFRVEGNQQ